MIVSIAQAQLFFLAFTRIMAVIIHVPVLGGNSIPSQYRVAFGVVLTIILVPWQPALTAAEPGGMALILFVIAVGRELLLGTLIGYAVSLTFGAVLIASEVMGLESGFSSSRIFNPVLGESGSAYNQFFVMVTTLVFLVINGHHTVLAALQRTFDIVPVNGLWTPGSPETLMRMTATLVAAGVQLALPLMCALLLTDITLGLLARVAPQVQVYFLGLPLKVGVALIGLSLALMSMFPLLENLYSQMGSRMLMLLEK